MLIFKETKFVKSPFDSEAELEGVVFENYEYLFGPNSILLPKAKIKTADGGGTIPDAFVIDIQLKKWYLVEAELIHHSVWSHIAPQVTKQLLASQQRTSTTKLIDITVELYKKDETVKEKFQDNNISEINVRKVVGEILETEPIIGIPIDAISNDLKDWAKTLKNTVKLWIISKFVEVNNNTNIVYEFPEEFKPALDTEEDIENSSKTNSSKSFEVEILDLVNAKLLSFSENLIMVYKPRNGTPKNFEAKILEDGSLEVLSQHFSSPSYAAIACIQNAGSDRKTVNGWTTWKSKKGKTIAELREEYLTQK